MTQPTNSVAAVLYAIMGGKYHIRLTSELGALPGRRCGYVVDDDGNIIGDAHDSPYGGRGFAVHTGPFAGFVDAKQVEFVE